jgi:hypothetical protein
MPTDDDEPKLKALPSIGCARETSAPNHKARREQIRDDLANVLSIAQESEAVATMLSACTAMSAEIPRAQWAAGVASLVRAARQLVRDLCDLIDRVDREFKNE